MLKQPITSKVMCHYASFLYTIAPTLLIYFHKFSSDNPHIGLVHKITKFKPLHSSLFILLEYFKDYRVAEYSEYLRPKILKARKYIFEGFFWCIDICLIMHNWIVSLSSLLSHWALDLLLWTLSFCSLYDSIKMECYLCNCIESGFSKC